MDLSALDRGRFTFRLFFFGGLRSLRRLRRLLGLWRPTTALRRRLGLRGSRGRFLVLGIRHRDHTPCFDSREMYVRSGGFSSFTYPPRAASRNRMRRVVGPGSDPGSSTDGVRRFPEWSKPPSGLTSPALSPSFKM